MAQRTEESSTAQGRGSERALPVPTADIQKVEQDLADFGYGLLRDALTRDEVSQLRDRILEQAECEKATGVAYLGDGSFENLQHVALGDADTPWQLVRTVLNKGAIFKAALEKPAILDLMKNALGRGMVLSSLSAIVTRGGAKAQPLHSDQQVWLPFQTPVPLLANVMYMVTDFVEGNGATRLVPGSHRYGPPVQRPIEKRSSTRDGVIATLSERAEAIPIEAAAGTALVFDGRTWHHGAENTNGSLRLGLAALFSVPTLIQQDILTLGLHDEVIDAMSGDMRRLCGFATAYGQRNVGKIDPGTGRTNVDIEWPRIGELRRST